MRWVAEARGGQQGEGGHEDDGGARERASAPWARGGVSRSGATSLRVENPGGGARLRPASVSWPCWAGREKCMATTVPSPSLRNSSASLIMRAIHRPRPPSASGSGAIWPASGSRIPGPVSLTSQISSPGSRHSFSRAGEAPWRIAFVAISSTASVWSSRRSPVSPAAAPSLSTRCRTASRFPMSKGICRAGCPPRTGVSALSFSTNSSGRAYSALSLLPPERMIRGCVDSADSMIASGSVLSS